MAAAYALGRQLVQRGLPVADRGARSRASLAARSRGPARAGLLALAAGAVYGLAAALTLNVTRLLRQHGVGQALGHWQLWALAGLGAADLLLSAGMLQVGALSASVPVVDAVETISAVLIGTLVFGERLAAFPAGLALQLADAAAAVSGILLLGRYSLEGGCPARGPRGGSMIAISSASSHHTSTPNQPIEVARLAANATVIAIPISSIVPGRLCVPRIPSTALTSKAVTESEHPAERNNRTFGA